MGSRKEKEDSEQKTEPIVEMEEGMPTAEQVEPKPNNENVNRKRRNETSSSSETESEPGLGSEKFKKTLRLNSEAIQCLNLKKGANEIQFSVTTAFQGTTRCSCHVYLWSHDDKIVISDIDGTITKSDVLGHVLPIIGRDWAQSGVASLFTKIVNNGYHIVYLSARAIGQASITKDYLASIKQGEVNLPDGPIFLNPTSLVNAFHREVIIKKPEEFKIACMTDIKRLFPETKNPFYAGYGNRVNDVWAYQAVGIPMSRIFTINPKGELRHELTNAFQTSYTDQSQDVDRLYPALDIRQYLADSLKNFTKIAQNPSSNNNIGPKFIWANGDHEDDDDLEDIFTMSSNESSPAPEDILTDTDSLYCDALSRKASIVRFLSARKALRALFNSAFLLCE